MKIGIIGAGGVGTALGTSALRGGHEVVYGVRNPQKAGELAGPGVSICSVSQVAALSDVIILATPWAAAEAALRAAGDFQNKPLVDAINPVGPGFVLTHGHEDSGGEQVARLAENARIVKCFNTTGKENLAAPNYTGKPADALAMPLCGDDSNACEVVAALARDMGFEPLVAGPLAMARNLEPYAMVWIKLAMAQGLGRGWGLVRVERSSASMA